MALSLITPNSLNLAQDYAGMGFGGTGSANQLDDYEEGTFTPIWGGTTTNPTVTYTEQLGRYTKVGRLVYINIRLVNSAVSGGSGNLVIKGLPFTGFSDGNNAHSLAKGFVYNFTTDIDTLFVESGNTQVTLYSSDNNNTYNAVSSLSSASYFNASGVYVAS